MDELKTKQILDLYNDQNNELDNKKINLLFISQNLKRLRLSHKLSTTDLAEVINMSRQGYLNYETGVREIGINSLIALSSFYNVSIDEIVGNPFTFRSMKTLEFRTYEFKEGALTQTTPMNISTINGDIICVKRDELHVDFFWKTQTNQKGQVMLFEYFDKPYISEVYFRTDGGGSFFINNEIIDFNKVQAERLVFIGVLASRLIKNFHVYNFF